MSAYSDARAALIASLVSNGPNTIHPETLAALIAALTDALIKNLIDAISGGTALASLDSPSFTGLPTAPTASAGTNTTQLATTAFVRAAITALINSAPGTLDTLGEIAAALAADESVVSALTSSLASKQPLAQDLTDIAGLSRAKGSLIVGGASAWLALAIGANGTIPYADSTQASGIRWDTAPSGGSTPANVTWTANGRLTLNGAADQGAGYGLCLNGYIWVQSGINASTGAIVSSQADLGWSRNGSTFHGSYPIMFGSVGTASPDTGLSRNAAGVVEINNGTAGTYRDLVVRHLTLTGSLGSPDLRALEIAVTELKGDRINMPNGIVDPFADASDIGTATNCTLASGKYAPTTTDVAVSGATGTSIGNGTSGAGLAAIFNGATNEAYSSGAGATGFASATDIWAGKTYGAGKRISKAVVYGSNDAGYVGNTNPACTLTLYGKNGVPANATDGTVLGTLSFTDTSNESGGRTIASIDTTTTYTNVWVALNSGGSGQSTTFAEVVIYEFTSTNNMTLISAAFTAASAPSLVRLGIQIKPIDAITINTDVIAYVSRDSGTTWTAATLALELAREDGTSIYVHDGLNISGQPSGTSMKWKIVTTNNKNVEIHGIDEFKWR